MSKNLGKIKYGLNQSAKVSLLLVVLSIVVYWLKFMPVPVEKYVLKKGTISNEVMGTGTLDAKVKSIISSKISGRIETVLVDQGDIVKANQLAVILDDEQLKFQMGVASATLETAESGVQKVREDLNFASVVLKNSIQTYQRYKKLIPNSAVSREAFDKATEDLGTARAKHSREELAVIEAENKVIEAKKILKLRKAQLDDSKIHIPFDGVIIRRERDSGNIVIPGSPILSLISTKVLWVRAWVDETELAKIKVDQAARVIFRSEAEHSYLGKVSRIAIEVDRETREFVVDVSVSELPANWAIGQRAEVYIQTDTKDNALIAPQKYITWKNNTSGVFVDKEGVTSWRAVETGMNDGHFIEITQGLQSGDAILTPINPLKALSDNSRVSVK